MKKLWIILLVILLALLPNSAAEDIVFSVDQSEYYFQTGQEAIIPLTINNTFNSSIDGTIAYSITQTVTQQGGQYSSTNSQSQSFSVQKGNNTIQINFGRSDSPLKLEADLEFSFSKLLISTDSPFFIVVSFWM